MPIARWINNFSGQQEMVEELTKKIAARCEAAVWARVQDTAPHMDPPQAHGYIRARAALVVEREVQIATASLRDLTKSTLELVSSNVSEVLVRQAMGMIAKQHPATLRRAA